jgi:single-strand DNA-binding protein
LGLHHSTVGALGDRSEQVEPTPEGIHMSRSVNKITLIGNVGRDPDMQQTKSGTKVAHFSLATNRRKPAEGEQEECTDWHRLTLWNRQAQFAEDYVRVGDRIYIEGRLEYESYERDGVTIPTAEIVVHTVVMLSPKAGVSDEDLEEAA